MLADSPFCESNHMFLQHNMVPVYGVPNQSNRGPLCAPLLIPRVSFTYTGQDWSVLIKEAFVLHRNAVSRQLPVFLLALFHPLPLFLSASLPPFFLSSVLSLPFLKHSSLFLFLPPPPPSRSFLFPPSLSLADSVPAVGPGQLSVEPAAQGQQLPARGDPAGQHPERVQGGDLHLRGGPGGL